MGTEGRVAHPLDRVVGAAASRACRARPPRTGQAVVGRGTPQRVRRADHPLRAGPFEHHHPGGLGLLGRRLVDLGGAQPPGRRGRRHQVGDSRRQVPDAGVEQSVEPGGDR